MPTVRPASDTLSTRYLFESVKIRRLWSGGRVAALVGIVVDCVADAGALSDFEHQASLYYDMRANDQEPAHENGDDHAKTMECVPGLVSVFHDMLFGESKHRINLKPE